MEEHAQTLQRGEGGVRQALQSKVQSRIRILGPEESIRQRPIIKKEEKPEKRALPKGHQLQHRDSQHKIHKVDGEVAFLPQPVLMAA